MRRGERMLVRGEEKTASVTEHKVVSSAVRCPCRLHMNVSFWWRLDALLIG